MIDGDGGGIVVVVGDIVGTPVTVPDGIAVGAVGITVGEPVGEPVGTAVGGGMIDGTAGGVVDSSVVSPAPTASTPTTLDTTKLIGAALLLAPASRRKVALTDPSTADTNKLPTTKPSGNCLVRLMFSLFSTVTTAKLGGSATSEPLLLNILKETLDVPDAGSSLESWMMFLRLRALSGKA